MANEALTAEKPTKKKRNRSKTRNHSEDDELPLSADDEVHQQTKAAVQQLMQQALQQQQQNDGKQGKKKKKTKAEQMMLESIKRGDGIRKDEEDTLLLANVYDPDDLKSKKSNKRRQLEMQQEKMEGLDNKAYIDGEVTQQKGKKKTTTTTTSKTATKKKHTKTEADITEQLELKTMTISDHAPPPQNEEPVYGTVKKKKKKKPPPAAEEMLSEDAEYSEDLDKAEEPMLTGAGPETDEIDAQEQTKAKKKRRKKKQQSKDEDLEAYAEALAEGAEAAPQEEEDAGPPGKDVEDDGRILGLTIHRTDKLKTDFYIAHPLVRVHVIDLDTGHYLKKQRKDRAVTSFYEAQNEQVDFILPIMTQPFDFKKKKSMLPVWEEMLFLNENFNYCIQEKPRVILIFEVLDFVSMNTAAQQYNTAKQEGGWHRIAWAFLKLRGANGQPNTDKKVRLQLYQPPVRFRSKGGQVEVYQWWKNTTNTRMAYPSTLYVTAKGIRPPDSVLPAARSMFATQEEVGKVTYDELQKTLDEGTIGRADTARRRGPAPWGRLPGQLCKIPNSLALTLPAGRKGCFTIKFSHDGKNLACGCQDKDGYPILIYEIPSGKLRGQILGHHQLIYELSWSRDDKQLLSASADCTAKVWDVEKMASNPVKILPNPVYVYTAKFHVRVSKVVVTGGYDNIIRVWSLQTDDATAFLAQELDEHPGMVNSLCFDEEGTKLYSGDSMGVLRVWNVYVTDKPSKRGILRDWTLNKVIDSPEFKGISINCIKFHPGGKRLLVHSRDNIIRMLDLRVMTVMQRYVGAVNFREHIRSTFTTCGSFVIAGSEDACAYVWNTESGDQVASYTELGYRHPVCDVDFHPHDHVLAFCSFAENHGIVVYKYDHKVAHQDAGLEPVTTMKRTGRPMSPEVRPGAARTDDPTLEMSRTHVSMAADEFRTQGATRLDRVRRKLDSVMAFQSMPSDHPLAVPRATSPLQHGAMTTVGMTWGSTFDSTAMYNQMSDSMPRAMSPEPGAFSPHASRSMTASMQQQQFAAQSNYLRDSGGSWRPGFSSVGRQGSGLRNSGRSPYLSLNASKGGKAEFSFQPPQGSQTPRTEQSDLEGLLRQYRSKYEQDMVIVLYDYMANRSDELSLIRGDIITVLYKDTDSWWMGELPNGQQGFFPVNYVTSYSEGDERNMGREGEEGEEENKEEFKIQVEPEDEEEEEKKTTTTAVVTKDGDLKFISGTEDSDADTPKKAARKKRLRKSRDSSMSIENEQPPARPPRRKKKSTSTLGESQA